MNKRNRERLAIAIAHGILAFALGYSTTHSDPLALLLILLLWLPVAHLYFTY
jgi:hypothetical protein